MQKIIEAALLNIMIILLAKNNRTPSSPLNAIVPVQAGTAWQDLLISFFLYKKESAGNWYQKMMAQATCGTRLGKCIILLGNLYISWNHHQIPIQIFPPNLYLITSHHVHIKPLTAQC